jgi:two-component system sensor histidine kinase KdpD
VVAGFVEHYDRPQTIAQIGDLEVVPRRQIPYGGTMVEEMDTDAVIARRPQVALVDELAHTNAPGSQREKRWQDVEAIRDAGIDVISTMNVQHLESVADIVESITGAPVRERLPDRVLDGADEVELIDMSPRALRQRLQQGDVYPRGRAQTALDSFFREGNLTALRELALRRTAQQVDEQLQEYMLGHGIDASWPASERVLVCVDHQPISRQLVRRAWRMASRLRAELLATYVEPPDRERLPFQVQKAVEANLRFAEDLGARVVRRKGRDVAAGLAALARDENVAQIVIGRSSHGRWHELLRGSVVNSLLRRVRDVDVHVIGDDTSDPHTP